MRLLVISEWFPYPPIAGAKIRAYNLIRQLARLAELDLVAQVRTLTSEQVAAGTAHLKQYCRLIEAVPVVPYRYDVVKALRTLVDPVPPVVRYMRNIPLERVGARPGGLGEPAQPTRCEIGRMNATVKTSGERLR